MPEKAKRARAILAALDSVARVAGVAGRFPSDIVKRAEQQSGTKWMSDLLPGVAAVSLDLGPRHHREQTEALVLFVEGAVDQWDAAWPGLIRAIVTNDKPVSPSKEVISGVTVQSFAIPAGHGSAVHIARVGNRIALGTSRPAVVRAVKAERTDSIRGGVGRIPPEWFVPSSATKPAAVKIPFLPPPTPADVLSPFPEIRFAANRHSATQANFEIIHDSWNREAVKTVAERFSHWLEGQFAGDLLVPERLEGGIMK